MEWLNYHHLHYFWVVAREGSMTVAGEMLHLSQPTLSSQIAKLERALGAKLFDRAARKLTLTDTGRTVYRYAEEIFALGRELTDAVKGLRVDQPLRLTVGIPDVLPKLVVHRLLSPAFALAQPVRIVCREGRFEELLAELAVHELDLVLSDAPAPPNVRVKVYNHLLGECRIGVFGGTALARQFGVDFPRSLDNAPFLLPNTSTGLRRRLDQWFDTHALRPRVIAEIADSALLKVFGQEGLGLFAAPLAIRAEIERQYDVVCLGELPELRERFYAVSVERRLKHAAVVAISNAARRELFAIAEGTQTE